MSKTYILFFCPNIYPDTIGGMEIYYYHLINELSQKDKVVLFTISRKYRNDKCRIIYISSNLFFIKKFNLGNLSLFITTFIRLIFLHPKISLIHLPCTSNSGFYGCFFPLIRKIFNIPYIIQFHGGGMRPWKKYDGNQLLFKHAAHILAVSDAIKIEYEKRTGRDIKVVLPLVPYTESAKTKGQLKQDYGYNDYDMIMIMVGSIKPFKGNIWVYNAYKNLTLEYLEKRHLKLLFVGEGGDSIKLKEIIKKDNMEHWVRIIDRIPNETIHEIYGLADYYVIGSDFEGTPKSLLEAMFNGLPIIGSNVNGINSILIDRYNCLLVKKVSVNDLSSVIHILLSNKELAIHLASNAKKTYIEKYDFSITIDQLCKTYRRVSNQPEYSYE